MNRYHRVRYRVSLEWICFSFWAYRKLTHFRAAVGLNPAEKADKRQVDVSYSP